MAKRKPDHRTVRSSQRAHPTPFVPWRPRPRADPQSTNAPSPGSQSAGGPSGHWLYGVHPVLAALANPRRHCHRLVVTAEAEQALGGRLAALLAGRPGLEAERLGRSELDRLLPGAVHQGLALRAEPLPEPGLEALLDRARTLDQAVLLVLDQVTDPHNVGAILRSAAAFGALGVVLTERHAPGATATLAKAASGALESTPLVRVVNLARSLEAIKAAGLWCAGLDSAASTELPEARLDGRIALVLGAEGQGLRRLTRQHCDVLVRIPMAPAAVASLNVSNAAAIALYELFRVRR